MSDEKLKKIPKISSDRIDSTVADSTIGTSKDEKTAYVFMKGKAQVQPLTIRVPLGLYQDLREYAFKNRIKMNQLVVNLLKEHIQTESR